MGKRLTAEGWHALGTVTPKEVLWDWQNDRIEFIKVLHKAMVYIADELYEARESFQSDTHIQNLEGLLAECRQVINFKEGERK